MTDTPDTSPEAVERLAKDHDEVGNSPGKYVMGHPHHRKTATTLRDLAAERGALKAELAEAVGLMQDIRDHGADDYVIDRALAFLARHQKEAEE